MDNNIQLSDGEPSQSNYVQSLRLSSDRMFSTMQENMQALEDVRLDGTGALPNGLQALRTNQFTPASQRQITESGAFPMTKEQANRQITALTRRQSLDNVKSQITAPSLSLRQTTGRRVRIAHRLTRHLAHIRGDAQLGGIMSMSLFSTKYNLRKWDIPIQDDPSRFGIIRNAAHVINLLLEAKESQETYTYLLGDTDSGRTGGFSYMPPPLTDDYFPSDDPRVIGQLRTQGYVPPDYDPSADPALLRYCQVMSLLANYLDIGRDSAIEASTVGALLIPEIARTSWPSADALEQYEETLLLPYIEEKLTSLSTKGVERWLQDEHNYTFYEAYDLVLAAKNMSSEIHDHNPLNERTTTLNSLDRLREDCVTEGHITTELNAIKTKIAVLGLTPRESDSKLEESENYARELDDVINAKQLPGPEIEDDLDESL